MILSQKIPPPSKVYSIKISQPTNHKDHKSIENIVLQLDEILEITKTRFEEIPNKKINYEQFRFIIENCLSVYNPALVHVWKL